MPFQIKNDARTDLTDFQVALLVDTSTAIQLGKMNADGSDIRFTSADGDRLLAYAIDLDLGTVETVVWVKLDALPASGTAGFMYYGNQDAVPRSSVAETFVPGIVSNPSFEGGGGWNVVLGAADLTTQSLSWPDSNGHATDGSSALSATLEQHGAHPRPMQMSVEQPVVFPEGDAYVLRFDLHILAASQGELGGGFSWFLGGAAIWSLNGRKGEIAYEHGGAETIPISPSVATLEFRLEINEEALGGFARASLDNLRIRKFVDPAPSVVLGDEETLCP